MGILKPLFIVIAMAITLLLPSRALACTPAPELLYFFYVFVSPSSWGAAIAAQSGGIMLGVIFIKSMLFAYKKGRPRGLAFVNMFIANIVSTLPGLFAVVITAIPISIIIAIPLLYIFYCKIGEYIIGNIKYVKGLAFINSKGLCASVLTISTLLSISFFVMSRAYIHGDMWHYWILKTAFTTLGVIVGLSISIFCEGAFINWANSREGEMSNDLFNSVVWANVWGAFISVGLAAAVMLPKRFESGNFLVLLERAIRSVFS